MHSTRISASHEEQRETEKKRREEAGRQVEEQAEGRMDTFREGEGEEEGESLKSIVSTA